MNDPTVPRQPFWQVQAVFDPDGQGGDFSYTIGLAEQDVPELHLLGRPALGDDPGECDDGLGRLVDEPIVGAA
jgi:hypothetical protein